jgi:hypothetical protein
MQTAEQTLENKSKAHEAAQRTLRAARCDLEKRINEHDTCVAEGKPANLVQVTLQMVKDQEKAVEAASAAAKVFPSLLDPTLPPKLMEIPLASLPTVKSAFTHCT